MKRKSICVNLLGMLVIMGLSYVNLPIVSAQVVESTEENKVIESQPISRLEKNLELDITPEIVDTEIHAVVGEGGQLTIKTLDFGKEIKLEELMNVSVKNPEILSMDTDGKWQALKAGETQVQVTFAFTEKDFEEIQKIYPDKELLTTEIARVLDVKITEKEVETLDITPVFNITNITAALNDSGQITVAPIGGVSEIKGTFKARGHDEAIFQVTADGKWTALAAGKTQFILDFEFSEETKKQIQEKHPGKELVIKAIAQTINVEITAERQFKTIDLNTGLATKTIVAAVGESGKLVANPIEGVENINGTFHSVMDTSDIITVDEQGNWTAQKAGITTLLITHTPSAETMTAIAANYPETTELIYPTIMSYEKIEVTITEPAETKPSGVIPTQAPSKELPKTGSEDSWEQASIGMMTSTFALGMLIYRKKRISE